MNDEELNALIGLHADRHRASQGLRAAVQTQVTLYAAGRKPAFARRWNVFSYLLAGRSAPMLLLASGSGLVCGVLLTLALGGSMPRFQVGDAASATGPGNLLGLHVRSMGAGPLLQVASSDRHTVKPWFQGKLDYAPEVPDLHEAGFDLLGGRIERVQGSDTAVLAYQLRKHIISAFVLPRDQVAPTQRLTLRGFHMALWSDGVMQVWAVTDADASELERFAVAWQSTVAAGSAQKSR